MKTIPIGVLFAFILLFCFSLLSGCGGSSGGSESVDTLDETESTTEESNGDEDNPVAYRWDVSLAYSGPCTAPDSELPLNVVVYDANGDILKDAAYTVSTDTPSMLEFNNGKWYVRGEGRQSITVNYSGQPAQGATLNPVLFDIVSDVTKPTIELLSPQRATMFETADDIRMDGSISDLHSALSSVVINDIEQLNSSVDNYLLDSFLEGNWGLNTLRISASDDCGNVASLSQSYLHSEQFLQAATVENISSRVISGQRLALKQEAVDDQSRGDLDDLATLLQRYLERNLNDLLYDATSGERVLTDSSTSFGCGVSTQVNVQTAGVTVAVPQVVAITLDHDKFIHKMLFQGIRIPLRVIQTIYVPGLCSSTSLALNATVTLDMNINMDTTSSVSNGQVSIHSQSPDITLSNVTISATGNSVVDSLLSSSLSLFTAYMSDAIEEPVADLVQSAEEDLLNPLLTSTASVGGDGYGVNLNVSSGLDGQDINPVQLTQAAFVQVYPTTTTQPAEVSGSIVRTVTPPDLENFPGPVTYAINDNLINNSLWALWYGGFIQVDDLLGVPGVTLQTSALLPPVIMPGVTNEESVLAIGDLSVTLELTRPSLSGGDSQDIQRTEAYVSAYISGTATYNSITRQMQFSHKADGKRIYVQIRSLSRNGVAVTEPEIIQSQQEYLRNLMEDAVLLVLNDTLHSVILPPLELDLYESIGDGTIEAISLSIEGLTDTADHIIIDARLGAQSASLVDDADFLSVNNSWDNDDLYNFDIASLYWPLLNYEETASLEPDFHEFSMTVGGYQDKIIECNNSETSSGEARCLTTWQEPLDYGWYCGAGRPIEGRKADNPILDPLDYCCRLHDQTLFTDHVPDLASRTGWDEFIIGASLDACGFALCLNQSKTSNPAIFQRMPQQEQARQHMYQRASILCAGAQPALGAPEVE